MSYFSIRPKGTALEVNTDPDRHYVVEKPELEGIADLRHLAETADLEEAWVCVQALDLEGRPRTLWYEVGEKETNGSVAHSSDHYKKILKDLDQRGFHLESWRLYHHHPKHSVETTDYRGQTLESVSVYISPADYLNHQLVNPIIQDYFFRNTPNTDARVVTYKGVFALDWRLRSIRTEDVTSTQYLEQLEKNLRAALFIALFHNSACKRNRVDLCLDDYFFKYGAALSTDLVQVQYFPYPIEKLPPTASVTDAEPQWVEGGWLLPLSLGAHWVHMDVGKGRIDGMGPQMGLGLGLGGAWQPRGVLAGLGLALHYTPVASESPKEEVLENFHLLDYGLWLRLGHNFGPVSLSLRPDLGGRNAHSWRYDRNAFRLGTDGVVSFLDGGLSLMAGGEFLIAGGSGLRVLFQLDVPSLIRSVE